MIKNSLHINLDRDLVDFIQIYAQERRTTISDVMTQFLLRLKRQEEGDSMDLILTRPDFHKEISEALARLRNGTAEWHTYGDVFGA